MIAVLLLAVAGATAQVEHISSTAQRELVNVTVYSAGIALVHDRRRIALDAGLNRVAWRDVSQQMDATSALLENPSAPDGISVLEQNLNYDLLDPSSMLEKYAGRDVTVVHPDGRSEIARILSTNDGVVLQYADRIETTVRGYLEYPEIPANFRDRPTLVLDVEASTSGEQTLDLSYITNGLTWRTDYVGSLAPDGTQIDLTGLVTISNTSGTSYTDAHLQLVAGDVAVAIPQAFGALVKAGTTADLYSVNAAAAPREENYFEYHLYTFPRTTTILDKQTKQLTLLHAAGVPVTKTLELRGTGSYYRSRAGDPDLGDRLPVGVYVTFENRGGDLGVPLPAGIVRMYQNDSRGTSLFLGSDTIRHTPKNEPVRLHLGNSFDVTARKRQTDFHMVGRCVFESSYAISLANAKSEPQDVRVVEPIPGDWSIPQEDLPHVKSSASTATWTMHLGPESTSTLEYTARIRVCV